MRSTDAGSTRALLESTLSPAAAPLTLWASPSAHVIHSVVREDQEHGFDLAGDVALLERALADRPQVRLVIIDPVTAYLTGSGDRGDNMRPALTRLTAVAEQRRVAVLLVTHLSKTSRGALERIHGSIAWAAVVRAAFFVMADPQDETRRLFVEVKNNLAQSSGLAFRLTCRTLAPGLRVSHVEWEDGIVAATADELLRQQPKPDAATGRQEAIAFIQAVLADGPKPVRESSARRSALRGSSSASRRSGPAGAGGRPNGFGLCRAGSRRRANEIADGSCE